MNALPLWAAEVHGQVQFGGLPLPGATVTASQGDRNFVAVADPMGNYSFPDLPDGAWAFKVEMLGFRGPQASERHCGRRRTGEQLRPEDALAR